MQVPPSPPIAHNVLTSWQQITPPCLEDPKSQSATIEPSPFLRLPVEIRKLVYICLIPNLTISPWYTEFEPSSGPRIRDDGACSSAILRVNRRIYNEVHGEWYGNPVYSLRIERDGIRFLNHQIPLAGALPSNIYAIRSLSISIYLIRLYDAPDRIRTQTQHIVALAGILSSDKSSLQKLRLYLGAGGPFFASARSDPGGLGKALDTNLNSVEHNIAIYHIIAIYRYNM